MRSWNVGGPKAYTEEDINSAIDAGVISEESAVALAQHVLAKSAPVADEEYFRLVSGFNDIFVSLACLLLLIPVNVLLGSYGGILVAALSWGLAEYFTRKKGLALTSILLLLGFAGGIYFFIIFMTDNIEAGWRYIIAGIVTAIAVFRHWKRFKVPATVACGALALAGVAIFTLTILVGLITYDSRIKIALPALVAGITIFLFAMKWDVSDPARLTRRSDVAFWLHLTAAPMIMHSFFYLIGVFDGDLQLWQSLVIILIYMCIAFISVTIDRRSLMVSSLGYVIYAFSDLFKNYGEMSDYFAISAIIISLPLLLLSALWQPARRLIYWHLPKTLQKILPRAG
jgi:hypothetical protein